MNKSKTLRIFRHAIGYLLGCSYFEYSAVYIDWPFSENALSQKLANFGDLYVQWALIKLIPFCCAALEHF